MEFLTTSYSEGPVSRELAKVVRLLEPELKRRFSEAELGSFDGTLIYAPVAFLKENPHFPAGQKLYKRKRELVCSPVLSGNIFLECGEQQKATEYLHGLRGAFCHFKVAGATKALSGCFEQVLSEVLEQFSG